MEEEESKQGDTFRYFFESYEHFREGSSVGMMEE